MSRKRRVVTEIHMGVTVVTADTRDDAHNRIITEVRRALELAFGNAVTVNLTGVDSVEAG